MRLTTPPMRSWLCGIALAVSTVAASAADQPAAPAAPVPATVPADAAWHASVDASLQRGAAFLVSRQDDSGMFGKVPMPGIAGLGAIALHGSPATDRAAVDAAALKALGSVLSYAQPDGGLFDAKAGKGAYPNYNTAIGLLTLVTFARPEDKPQIVAARRFLKQMQIDDTESIHYGGFSYGASQKGARSDLSNAAWVAEALYYSESYEADQPGSQDAAEKTTAVWKAFSTFLAHSQKAADPNAKADDKTDKDVGGFAYIPGKDASKLVTSGGMSYAGLKSMVYARLSPDDVRVKSVMRYVATNYTVDENPGQGQEGYYYYVLMMAKALAASGVDDLVLADGSHHNWRQELSEKLISLQQKDGSWVNPAGRFMESAPELSTPFAMIALRVAAGTPGTQPAKP